MPAYMVVYRGNTPIIYTGTSCIMAISDLDSAIVVELNLEFGPNPIKAPIMINLYDLWNLMY